MKRHRHNAGHGMELDSCRNWTQKKPNIIHHECEINEIKWGGVERMRFEEISKIGKESNKVKRGNIGGGVKVGETIKKNTEGDQINERGAALGERVLNGQ